MRKRWLSVGAVMGLILLPVGFWWLYLEITKFPERIVIATGSPRGRYREISKALKLEIEAKLDVKVEIFETDGSLGNLLSLRADKADFALYQPGTIEVLRVHPSQLVTIAENKAGLRSPAQEVENVAFVANLYLQPAHLIVRSGANIKNPAQLKKRTVNLGLLHSGDHAMGLVLLEHLGLEDDGDIKARYLTYDQIEDGMLKEDLNGDEKLDATINTVGVPAQHLQELFKTGKCDILEIPHAKALARKHGFLSEFTIPAGLYHSQPPAKPAKDVKTVALSAQLLTHKDLNPHLIQEVTKIVLDKHFARQHDLHELLEGGKEFAQAKPEFPIHQGAQSVYDPEFDIHLIESWEAAYSLAVSTVIAVFFGVQWLRKRKARNKEHKLDVYIQKLLDIEQRQLGLDEDAEANDVKLLQKLLDDVTLLRQTALRVFSIHELNEDRGADCFIEMCHALSNKINAKISRQRLDMCFAELVGVIERQTNSTNESAGDS